MVKKTLYKPNMLDYAVTQAVKTFKNGLADVDLELSYFKSSILDDVALVDARETTHLKEKFSYLNGEVVDNMVDFYITVLAGIDAGQSIFLNAIDANLEGKQTYISSYLERFSYGQNVQKFFSQIPIFKSFCEMI